MSITIHVNKGYEVRRDSGEYGLSAPYIMQPNGEPYRTPGGMIRTYVNETAAINAVKRCVASDSINRAEKIKAAYFPPSS